MNLLRHCLTDPTRQLLAVKSQGIHNWTTGS